MIYYIDTEFSRFRGELMSIGIVSADMSRRFYCVLPLPDNIDPWVVENVVPYLYLSHKEFGPEWINAVDEEEAARRIADFFKDDECPTIVADWPEDLKFFADLLIIGPGEMVNIQGFNLLYRKTPGWNSANHSEIPHNAYCDAIAIRNYFESTEKD